MKLNEKIVRLREQYNLTQANFAELINVSRFTVLRWERGRSRPRERHVQRICKVFRLERKNLIFDGEALVFMQEKGKRRKGEAEICGEIVLTVVARSYEDVESLQTASEEYVVGRLQEALSLMTKAEEEETAFSQERTYFYLGKGASFDCFEKNPEKCRREKKAKRKGKGIFRRFR